MKKILYTSLISALFASTAWADAETASADPKTCANFGGFYAGVLVGYGSGSGNTTQHITDTQPAAAAPQPVRLLYTKDQVAVKGANGGIVLGYGKQMGTSKVYLGLDLNYTFDGEKGKADPVKVSRKDAVELSARVGAIVANAMPFLKFGVVNAKINGSVEASNGSIRNYLNDRITGWLLGLGVDFKLTPRIVAGLDYTYASFPKKGKVVKGDYNDVPALALAGNLSDNIKTQLQDNKFRIKVAYQF